MDWSYGGVNKKYNLKNGDVVQGKFGILKVADIIDDRLEEFNNLKIGMTYIDPPWNKGNINSFYTKAGLTIRRDFDRFINQLLSVLVRVKAPINYMEMGRQNVVWVVKKIGEFGGNVVEVFNGTYYKTKPMNIIKYTFATGYLDNRVDLNGRDDGDTPGIVIAHENVTSVMDLCTGMGLTARECFKHGKLFYGTELNPKRAAHLLDFYTENGVAFDIKRV